MRNKETKIILILSIPSTHHVLVDKYVKLQSFDVFLNSCGYLPLSS